MYPFKKSFVGIAQIMCIMLISVMANAQSGPPQGGGRPSGGAPQQGERIGYGKVSGTIVDTDGNPVPFATVSLTIPGANKVIDGAVANEKGQFSIRNIVEGSYQVNVSFIGYESQSKGPYSFTGKGEAYDLGSIQLATSSTELNEVVVEGQRDLIEDKVDRIVYNAEQDKTTMGGDASDVLRRVPLLSVDLDGNVSLRGSSNIMVLIDGRPSTMTATSVADALRQIPADQIKSVEVITSPSARYDAEGTGGIINIITKKNDLQGGSLSINSSAGFRGSNLGLNAAYRQGRMGLTLGGFGRAGYNIRGKFENEQTTLNTQGEELSTTTQLAESRNRMLMGRYNLGMDYAINKFNWMGATVNFGLFNFNMDQDGRSTNTTDMNGMRSRLEDVSMANLSNNVDASANYIRTYEEKGRELSVLGMYSQNSRVNDFDIYTLQNDAASYFAGIRNENDSYNREYTVQLDYVDPIGDKMIIETGAKNIVRNVTSEFQYLVSEDGTIYSTLGNNSLNNNFSYNQNVAAGYLSGTFELPKGFSAKVGGRYEYTSINANFAGESDLTIPDYGILVPSVNLSKKIKQMNTLKFAYSRRIQRPSLQFLNPNVNASNQQNISQGNPLLDPEFTDNFEISYGTFKKGTSVNISAFMRNTNGSIQSVRETIGVDTVLTTFQNIGEEDAYGLSLFSNARLGKFTLNGGFDGYYAILDNNVQDPILNASNQGFVVSGRLMGSYEMSEFWAFQFFGFIRGNQVQLQGRQTGFYIYSLSLNRNFAEKKGSIGFGIENFLQEGMVMRTQVESPLVLQDNTNTQYNFNFKVNFNYRIGKMTNGQQRNRMKKVDNNDLKGGGGNEEL